MADPMHNGRPIIQERQTALGLYVTAKEAYDMWRADPEHVTILDVRTPEEWVFTGHPPAAVNIPLAFMAYVWNEERKGFTWEMNPEFVAKATERFSADDTLLITCRSGGRAAMAINLLNKAAGFTKLYNILDGMEGDIVDDPDSVFKGMRRKNGWIMSNLPWTYDLDPSVMALPERETGELHPGNAAD